MRELGKLYQLQRDINLWTKTKTTLRSVARAGGTEQGDKNDPVHDNNFNFKCVCFGFLCPTL